MKVLLENKFHYYRGGSETYYFALADALRKAGHEVIFFAMQDDNNLPCAQSRYFAPHVDFHKPMGKFEQLKTGMTAIYSKPAKQQFERLLDVEHPDVVHLNLVHKQITLSIVDACYERHIPVVMTCHDYILVCPEYLMINGHGEVCSQCFDGNFGHCVDNRCIDGSRAKSLLAKKEADYIRSHHLYEKISRFIAPSEFMRQQLLMGGFPDSQVVTMQNFASDAVLERARHPIAEERERHFLFFGRLAKEKGVDILLEAYALAVQAGLDTNWRLLIAGDGPERPNLENLSKNLGISEYIDFLGKLDPDAMGECVSNCAWSVIPSRWNENMPYSIIESFAAGTPVIGSAIGGIPELVVNDETGLTFLPDDPASLSEMLMRASCQSKTTWCDYSANCKQYVLDKCDSKRYITALEKLYGAVATKGDNVNL